MWAQFFGRSKCLGSCSRISIGSLHSAQDMKPEGDAAHLQHSTAWKALPEFSLLTHLWLPSWGVKTELENDERVKHWKTCKTQNVKSRLWVLWVCCVVQLSPRTSKPMMAAPTVPRSHPPKEASEVQVDNICKRIEVWKCVVRWWIVYWLLCLKLPQFQYVMSERNGELQK